MKKRCEVPAALQNRAAPAVDLGDVDFKRDCTRPMGNVFQRVESESVLKNVIGGVEIPFKGRKPRFFPSKTPKITFSLVKPV